MALSNLAKDIKLYLRISHNLLDDEIEKVIASARQEMIRAGVSTAVANGEDTDSVEIVETAIKTYAKMYYADTKDGEKYAESFEYQLDNIRKTYPKEVVEDV